MRKTVFIPLFALRGEGESSLLELIIERTARFHRPSPDFGHLHSHGLRIAISSAVAALRASGLVRTRSRLAGLRCTEPAPAGASSMLYLANPEPGLSNAKGAALGVAMSLLMYDGRCSLQRLIATGHLQADGAITGGADALATKLESAIPLGYQPEPLPFLVPSSALMRASRPNHMISALSRLNIQVRPVADLTEAASV